jgi:tRNA-2-methylthio-N6-dimethylallyladenosine synthase
VQGVKEVTLLGQIVNLYGRHEFLSIAAVAGRSCKKSPFVQLLEAVSAIDGLERLRFTSPHPIGFRDDLIEAIADLPKLTEHVHLPLQSGSNRILKAMHRTYTAEKYAQLVDEIRAARPGIALTTDIIVGFPGETDSDYKATRDLVEHLQFDNAFVFRGAKRPPRPCRIKLTRQQRRRAIRTCSEESTPRPAARMKNWSELALRFCVKAQAKQTLRV